MEKRRSNIRKAKKYCERMGYKFVYMLTDALFKAYNADGKLITRDVEWL